MHCHVNASPKRTEMMSEQTIATIFEVLTHAEFNTLDITGGAPELHPQFRKLVKHARASGIKVIDRCNLTVLEQPGQEDTAEFLAEHNVEIVASLPCYLEENVNRQRGDGVFQSSIRVLKKLNALGYGKEKILNLVYNPQGATLPPEQQQLEKQYKDYLKENHAIQFNELFVICNMPINRFGSTLLSNNEFDPYMELLKKAYKPENLQNVMCRDLISVDWQGYLYDCDFNQMLGLPMQQGARHRLHLTDILESDVVNNKITVKDHCYACTAGQGSSCGGALSH